MKNKKQPKMYEIEVVCDTCKEKHKIGTTVTKMKIDTCSNCDSFYNNTQEFITVAGQVDKFNKKYNYTLHKKEKKEENKNDKK
ncbi:ribosomal protein L31 [Candidatus Phytoplasma oryzae]|uniref:50S ribosomal protein L31 n=1 Tax=Candidatus Phytoplasma oryzae TaxID=203274 RepID=A0A139JRG9_9MOLU|nr:50S ribosomal protein L31 [Candidatus Phytoplasma oryzae]KXT29450.1 ribosomal protein L31 [Candidatus Phytoplasma oryzae]RAM58030.1 50S ribosomal protein L31 [Candidatus Phytoplasma oryzae]